MSLLRELKDLSQALLTSKSGKVGIIILTIVFGISIFAVIYVPFDVVAKWNEPTFWQKNPRTVAPQWGTFLLNKDLPPTINVASEEFNKNEYFVTTDHLKYVTLERMITYDYDDFPSELAAIIYANYTEHRPLATITLERPDGTEAVLYRNILTNPVNRLYISSDRDIRNNVESFLVNLGVETTRTIYPEICLFAIKNEDMLDTRKASVLKGFYRIRIDVIATEESDTADAEFLIYGQVYGFAGTDSNRRDLFIGLVWGAPVALAFGLSAAIVTSVIQSLLGAISAWYGGIVDEVIQRVTETYMILPFLPFLIMISIFYKVDIWFLIVIIVALSLFGGVTKTARSVTFQIMNEQYIEAAESYGASKRRILFLYIMPRLLPYIVANIVLAVPAYVFLEAALSVLGLGDQMVPTWGKMISDAYSGGAAVHGYWWWILLPAFLIMITASAFAFIGYALDKVVNPRLRER
jgi:peptide/nickel transport system permease protein